MMKHISSILVICFVYTLAVFAAKPDWPYFRGPRYDSISPETNWAPLQGTNDLKITWERNIGDGYSCVTIAGPHLFTMGNTAGTATVWCLEATTGKTVWQYSFSSPIGRFKGPRATPVWEDGKLYAVSRKGDIFCLDAGKGTLIWQKNIADLFGVVIPKWGFAASVRIYNDLLLVNGNEYGLALDKKTGKKAWASPAGQGGYATPVIATVNKKPQALFFGKEALYGVDPGTGKKLWSFTWIFRNRVNAADPIVMGDTVFISSGYGKGCALVQVKGTKVTQLWANTEMENHFSTCILLDGYLYGCDGNTGKGDLVCMNAKTGKEQWRQPTGFFSPLAAKNILILLNEKGELIFAKATPEKYEELGRCMVFNNTRERCWTMPVLCRGKLYCRNSAGRLVCIDVSK
jgi:outer membrane protein assembly factor BamB